jgi:hypothetical protein
VKKDLRSKKLVSALPPGARDLKITMEVRAYRERPSGKEAGRSLTAAQRAQSRATKSSTQSLWEYLVSQAALGTADH